VRLRVVASLLFPVLLSACVALAQATDEIEQKERELRQIRDKLAESREKAEELENKETSTLEKLEGLDVKIELNQKLTDELKAKERRVEKDISDVKQDIDASEKRLKDRQRILERRLRAMYKHGSLHPLEMILTARSFPDMVIRAKYLTLIAEQDVRLKNQIERTKEELVESGEELSRHLSEMKSTRGEKEAELKKLDSDKEKREGILEETRREKKKQKEVAKELERAEKKLQSLIDDLIRSRAEEVKEEGTPALPGDWDFAKRKGKLRWPAEGKVLSGFGTQKHPKYGTSTLNNGIDIKAPKGANVKAVADGQTIYADRFLGYGQVVILDHGAGYYTLYAHRSAIYTDVGSVVGEGDVIGEVGDSGSLEGSRLHFEVREEGRPVDPSAWLRK
jgi:septal ring factor EnvC (AmiA/AmiB activator)